MFTGIIEELGQIRKISRLSLRTVFEIKAEKTLEGTRQGESIAVNGVCLTVIGKTKDSLIFDAIPETLKNTNLGTLKPADKVNLERSLKIGQRLCGHFVTGHVDCPGIIREKRLVSGNMSFEIALPAAFARYIIPKGSIAVDGISLTIADKKANTFRVYIIPHTLAHTTLAFKMPSHKVNIECDILAKRGNIELLQK